MTKCSQCMTIEIMRDGKDIVYEAFTEPTDVDACMGNVLPLICKIILFTAIAMQFVPHNNILFDS